MKRDRITFRPSRDRGANLIEDIERLAKRKHVSFNHMIETALLGYIASQKRESQPREPKAEVQDFISRLLTDFQDAYTLFHGQPYIVTNPGKERSAIGKILEIYKKHYPGMDSEQTEAALQDYFSRCVSIEDPWLRENMSPSIIVSQFNKITTILKNGKQKSAGATQQQVAAIARG